MTNKTNDELENIANGMLEMLIEDEEFEELTPEQRTILCAKVAAKFATYAGDAINF